MPSTPTASLRIELQETGSNVNTWGQHLNSSALILLDSAIAGRTTIANPTSGQTLSSVNYSTDQARQPVIEFTGTVAGDIPVNVGAVTKLYLIRDATGGGTLTFQTTMGAGVALAKSGYMPVAVTSSGVEDARTYELSPAHAPTNPGGIVTRTSLGATLSATGMSVLYVPATSGQVVTLGTLGLTLSSVGMPAGYSPISNSSVTNKSYVDASITAAMLSGTLPGQSGNAGKYLATDGAAANWSSVPEMNIITALAIGAL